MRRRILGAILASAAIALLGFGAPLAVSVRNRYRDEALVRLSAAAAAAAVDVPGSFAREHDLPELPDPIPDIRIGLYGTDGARVLGVGPDRADTTVTRALTSGTVDQDRDHLVVAFPISDEETVVGAIRASTPGSVVTARTQRTWAAMAALAAAVFGAATLLALRRSRTLARPLGQLRDDARAIGEGGEIPARDDHGIVEIDAVHHALVDAASRLNELLSRERALSTDLAHQLRTPLASLRLRLENEQTRPDHDHGLVEDALRDLDRLETTIDDLVELARDRAPTASPRPIATLLRESLAPWRQILQAHGRTLDVSIDAELPYVTARPQAVKQILDVLVGNAVEHGEGTVSINATRLANGTVVAVSDQGTATLDPTVVFQRRNPDAVGSGIGLALARRLAEAEDLRLILADSGPGPTFHLVFGGTRPTGARLSR